MTEWEHDSQVSATQHCYCFQTPPVSAPVAAAAEIAEMCSCLSRLSLSWSGRFLRGGNYVDICSVKCSICSRGAEENCLGEKARSATGELKRDEWRVGKQEQGLMGDLS